MSRKRKPIAERFWPKVDVRGPDECWPWLAGMSGGYGAFQMPNGKNGRHVSASRVAWELASGKSAGKRMVLHSCDNPPCCNPAHLRLGSVRDNALDAVERGRWVDHAGEKHPMAKLTAEQVEEIRADPRASGEIASEYGVSARHVRKIRAGTTWSR